MMIRVAFVLLAMAAPLAAAWADAPAEISSPAVENIAATAAPASLLSLPAERVARLSPVLKTMRDILLSERERLAVLEAAFAEETDLVECLEIQKQIREVKVQTEISLARAQLEDARRDGREQIVQELEEALERMTQPVARGTGSTLVRPRGVAEAKEGGHGAQK